MILEALLNLIKTLLQIVFGWINIPAFPEGLVSSISTFLDLIFDNLTLLRIFYKTSNYRNSCSYFNYSSKF